MRTDIGILFDRLPARPIKFGGIEMPKGPPEPPFVQLAQFILRPVEFLTRCKNRYGPVYTLRLSGVPPLVQFTHPEAVRAIFTGSSDVFHAGKANSILKPFLGKHSLLVLDGDLHMEQRRLLLPPFRGERMATYTRTMQEIADRAVQAWPRDRAFAVHGSFQEIALAIILRTVFGLEGAEMHEIGALLAESLAAVSNPLLLVGYFQVDLGRRSPWGRFVALMKEVHRRVDATIEARRRAGAAGRDDVLSLLLEARHEDGAVMTNAEIRDELLTMLIAGHETTTTALAWTLHRLGRHPGVCDRAIAEVDAARAGGDLPSPDAALPFLDAIAKETLRLHPVVPGVGRVVMRDTEIDGVRIPAKAACAVSIYLLHRNPDVWPDPERFDPERFLDRKPSPYEFLPFGGGIRRCVGMAFALAEMRVVLATVLSRIRPQAAPRANTRIARRNLTLSPSDGGLIVATSRGEDARRKSVLSAATSS